MSALLAEWGLWGLFASAFVSSTLLPGGSEALLLLLSHQEVAPDLTLLLVATTGNILGGMTSWALGRWLVGRPALQPHTPRVAAATARLRRWGAPVLLLSWLPVVGDPLCVAAGWLRVHPGLAALCIAAGKAGRYALLLALAGAV